MKMGKDTLHVEMQIASELPQWKISNRLGLLLLTTEMFMKEFIHMFLSTGNHVECIVAVIAHTVQVWWISIRLKMLKFSLKHVCA